ncbi:MAG: Appr-1-p processing protein [Zavarzinella sp.]|nr:Appr-1-p processing protein [Zavarzinella sp.]
MSGITYVTGDATAPQGEGPKIICHVCNDIGKWGAGFVLAVSRRWPQPEASYREWYAGRDGNGFGLGAVQFVQVAPDHWVANLVGQHGIRTAKGQSPVRYDAIAEGLRRVGEKAIELGSSVHMPRIGCGLAGGSWDRIEPLIQAALTDRGVPVTVYDFGG